ncbi:MAG: VOC family protein [Anaerolineales bacterium]|nr:VOC family protein [Anaerolineales bacterium]
MNTLFALPTQLSLSYSIHPQTSLGAVHLGAANLEWLAGFYCNILGLRLHSQQGAVMTLGAGEPFLVLHGDTGLRPRPRGVTGLYHFALLVPNRFELKRLLLRLMEARYPLQGGSDHLVSEAIYLADPEGNGIEVYHDRARETWRAADGSLRMSADPLDVEGILGEAGDSRPAGPGFAPSTRLGHVHLTVSRLDEAEEFYCGLLGFEPMMRMGGSALFVSAGGYHHHIGLNTWEGVGAPPPPRGSTGLSEFTILLPDRVEVDRLAERLRIANYPLIQGLDGVRLQDPSGNGILLASQ